MMQPVSHQAMLAGLLLSRTAVALNCGNSTAPFVDLGYEIHTATINTTGDYYIFSNIPYAKQPVDELRFQLPVAITDKSSTINNGSTAAICIQGAPLWAIEQNAESLGVPVELVEQIFWSQADQTEACLMLDVYVPARTFSKRSAAKTPVLAYIHGGGFTAGSKVTNPAGLVARSQLDDGEGIIFVAISYRLGLYGWLGGGNDTIPNLGLHDQLRALEWVQEYIALFGGDPGQVTVMGESAGASSILFQITSYGGNTTLPFQRAILQSPAFQFNINATAGYEVTMEVASNVTGTTISTVADLASLDAATLKVVNEQANLAASWGSVAFGAGPDGTYVPKIPQLLLAEGAFNREIELLIGHNSNESVLFVSPAISNDAELLANIKAEFPEASNKTLAYILDVLYPVTNYATPFQRAVQITTDADFSCTTRYVAVAKDNDTFNYLFAIPPGYHAEDTAYTFYNGDSGTLDNGYPLYVPMAYAMQDSIIGFTQSGDPNKAPVALSVSFPVYSSDAQVLAFTDAGLVTETDDMDNVRCAWWQQAMIQGLV